MLMDKKWIYLLVGVALGAVVLPKVRSAVGK